MTDAANPPQAPESTDDGLTVRERRALHAKTQARKSAPGKLARKAIVPAIVILVIAGISAGFYFESKQQDTCPGHWHAAYAVFVNNTNVPFPNDFAHREMFSPPGGHDHHLHNNDGIYHFHPQATRCIPTEDMMDRLGVTIKGEKLTLSPSHGPYAGTYAPDGNATLQIWYQPYNQEWRQVTWSYLDGRQIVNGGRVLITYGDLTAEQLQAQQDTLKDLGSYDPGDV